MESFQFHAGPQRTQYQSSSTPFKLDEGFSEALPSQDENGQTVSAAAAASFQEWVMAQNEDSRAEIAYEVLRTLRTSSIAAVVERLTPLLHMDPVEKLPPETTAEIFSYLDASTLLLASLASRTWRERILDSRLWKILYDAQGWGFDSDMIRAFDNLHSGLFKSKGKGRAYARESNSSRDQPQHKKRATQGWLDNRDRRISADTSRWREQHGRIEADTDDNGDEEDSEMRDVSIESSQLSPPRPNKRHSQDSGDEMDINSPSRHSISHRIDLDDSYFQGEMHPPLRPTLQSRETSGTERINWSFLYKQRKRLEDNWNQGRFTNFQLPHSQYPQEAHTECVYTIQFFGKWLVSGSRDKTLRVWDLETRRLRGKPLVGHSQSVLCLQFDPTEGEDVIISGSSDTSIIIWRFSTGQKIQEIPQAHSESVLNLRFDKRYLVTCSKDKLIKIWNRRDLLPTDPDYPRVSTLSEARLPSYIIDISKYSPSQLNEMIDFQKIKPLRPYTCIIVLRGHGAAVNAIQIDGDQVVSASGDRNIKIWNVKDGRCIRTISGHLKGIACVQYDSRRIVSGSSDNTVRIYDPATGAEVASLQGHTNLVRTVQAGFGDLPGSEEEFDSQARAAETEYLKDVRAGVIADDGGVRHTPRRIRRTSVGTRLPSSVVTASTPTRRLAFGAKIPPGGGGSQWGRIVSGSYDESIIIWKRDPKGEWVPSQKLRQETAVRAIAETSRRSLDPRAAPFTSSTSHPAGANQPMPSAAQIVQQAMTNSIAGLPTGVQTALNLGTQANGPSATWNLPSTQPHANWPLPSPETMSVVRGLLGPGAQQAMHHLHAQAQTLMQAQASMNQAAPQAHPVASSSSAPATSDPDIIGQVPAPPQQQQQQQQQPSSQTFHHQATHTSAPTAHQQATNNNAPPANGAAGQDDGGNNGHPLLPAGSVSRVFKLQFDARRIICCSQDSRIIGWDFANGDPEIAEASRFFVGP